MVYPTEIYLKQQLILKRYSTHYLVKLTALHLEGTIPSVSTFGTGWQPYTFGGLLVLPHQRALSFHSLATQLGDKLNLAGGDCNRMSSSQPLHLDSN